MPLPACGSSARIMSKPASFPFLIRRLRRHGTTSQSRGLAGCGLSVATPGPPPRGVAPGGWQRSFLRCRNSAELWWMALDSPADPANNGFDRKEIVAREAAWRLVEDLRSSDPACARVYLVSGQTCRRSACAESRHPLTCTSVSERDVVTGAVPDNTVALGGWPIGGDGARGTAGMRGSWRRGGTREDPVVGYARCPGPADNVFVAGRLAGADGGPTGRPA